MRIDTGEMFAIKILRLEKMIDREASGLFSREIQALRSIRHSNIIRIFEENLGSDYENPAFVMELAKMNLAEYMSVCAQPASRPDGRRMLIPEDSVQVMLSALEAVGALHDHQPQIIHRDINPNNILLLQDGRWVLADFGLAKFIGTSVASDITRTTSRGWGTFPYTAPEQFNDFKRVDQRTDIYSLGVLLWELFSDEQFPMPAVDTVMPPPLRDIFARAVARRAIDRFRTVWEMKNDFEKAVATCRETFWYPETDP